MHDDCDGLELCECGDYCRDHVLGRGRCRICSWASPDWLACTRFKVARREAIGAEEPS